MNHKLALFYQNERKLELLVSQEGPTLSMGLATTTYDSMQPLSERVGFKSYFAIAKIKNEYVGHTWVNLLDIDELRDSDGAVLCEALGKLWGLFDEESLLLPNLFKKENFQREEITFYGGTFNPWHEGHSECLRKCPATNIVIVPDSSPWKNRDVKRCYYKSYLDICRKFEESHYSIYPGFFGLEHSNPTAYWISQLRETKCSFLMGDDNFKALFKWIDIENLLVKLNKIYVLSRDHSLESLEEVSLEARKINPLLDIIFLGDHEFKNLSSTKLRQR